MRVPANDGGSSGSSSGSGETTDNDDGATQRERDLTRGAGDTVDNDSSSDSGGTDRSDSQPTQRERDLTRGSGDTLAPDEGTTRHDPNPTQRERDLTRGSGDTLEAHEKTQRDGEGPSERERDLTRGSGDTLASDEETGPINTQRDDDQGGLGDRVDSGLRSLTGGRAGLSDDFTSTDDSGGVRNTVSTLVGQPIAGRGRDFQKKRDRDGEQFGDFDWSFGLGGEEDEVEETLDDVPDDVRGRIEPGAEKLFSEDVAGQSAGEYLLTKSGNEELGQQYDEGIRKMGTGIVSDTPAAVASIPGFALEAAEAGGHAITNPQETVGDAPDAVAASATETYDAFSENPWRATGALVGTTAIGFGVGRGKGGRPRTSSGKSRASGGSKTSTRTPRTLAGDNRGQLKLTGRGRDRGGADRGSSRSGDSGSVLPDNIDEMLRGMEQAKGRRDANARAEKKVREEHIEAGKRQERGADPVTVDTRPGGDYTAPQRGGGYTADKSPDTTRSGPTNSQTATWRSSADSDLSPRESQLVAQLRRDTPAGDLRDLETTRRSTPDTDLRSVDSPSSSSTRSTAAGTASGASADPVFEMNELRQQAEQPDVTADDAGAVGAIEDTSLDDGEATGTVTDTDIMGVMDGAQEPTVSVEGNDTETGTGVGVGSDTDTEVGTGLDNDVDTTPVSDVDVGVDTGTAVDTDTDTMEDQLPGLISDGIVGPGRPGTTDPETPGRGVGRPPGRTPETPGRTPGRPPTTPGGGRPRRLRIRVPDIDLDSSKKKKRDRRLETGTAGYEFEFRNPVSGEFDLEDGDGSDESWGLGELL